MVNSELFLKSDAGFRYPEFCNPEFCSPEFWNPELFLLSIEFEGRVAIVSLFLFGRVQYFSSGVLLFWSVGEITGGVLLLFRSKLGFDSILWSFIEVVNL